MLHPVYMVISGIQTQNVSGDSTGSHKSNYHTITTIMAPNGNLDSPPLIVPPHQMTPFLFGQNSDALR